MRKVHTIVVVLAGTLAALSGCMSDATESGDGETNDTGDAVAAAAGDAASLEPEDATPVVEDVAPLPAEAASELNAAPELAVSPQVSTSGSSAVFHPGTKPYILVSDTAGDSHQVYVLYKINNGSEVRKTNSGGFGSTLKVPLPGGHYNLQLRACVDIQLAPDRCSSTQFTHN